MLLPLTRLVNSRVEGMLYLIFDYKFYCHPKGVGEL